MVFIELFAGMTTNGNAKRLYIVFDNQSMIEAIYKDKNALDRDYPKNTLFERVTITSKDYNFYKKHPRFKN